MSQQISEWAHSVLQQLSEKAPAGSGLSVRAWKHLLNESGFCSALAETPVRKDDVCTTTYAVCRSVLESLSEPPRGGFLSAVHDALSYAMYPEAAYEAPGAHLNAAIGFYLTVLDARIRLERSMRAFDPLTDVMPLTDADRAESRITDEYTRFLASINDARYMDLMRLTKEIRPFDPLSHTAGVHFVAAHIAQQAFACGLPVDRALVCASALAHDMGKFGCRGDNTGRTPYLHYYFTDRWLIEHDLPHIAHIAANHSTWDLEFENLPVESLILIYADFLVRGTRDAGGKEIFRIHTLDEACAVVAGKLADMDAKKRLRYNRVTHKLKDFEEYLVSLGVNTDPFAESTNPPAAFEPALLDRQACIHALSMCALSHSLAFMREVSAGEPFAQLIENARAERSSERIRTYLSLFSEYSAYLPREQKLRTLDFLCELVMHPDGDVRRQAGLLMGKILANSGLAYRKELPPGVYNDAPTLSEQLAASFSLCGSFIERLLFPDHKLEKVLILRAKNSLKVMIGSLFACCAPGDARAYLDVFLRYFAPEHEADAFTLYESVVRVPVALFSRAELSSLIAGAAPLLYAGRAEERICAIAALTHFLAARPEDVRGSIESLLSARPAGGAAWDGTSDYALNRLMSRLSGAAFSEALDERTVSELYLQNLKSAVHFAQKLVNIDRLYQHACLNKQDAFHVSTHLSNLLLISEHLPVREYAGKTLLRLSSQLSVDQRNEIVIDLCRGLETLDLQYSRYIPPCLGALTAELPAMEQTETIDQLEKLVRTGSARVACAALLTLGQVLICADYDREDNDRLTAARCERILGVLLVGAAHFNDEVHRMAVRVLCHDVFSADRLSLVRRRSLFMRLCKRFYLLLTERDERGVTFYNTAAMLNHLYRMIVECEVTFGPFTFPAAGAAAFFPGTFDPFSDGHKRIVTEIAALGMEVFLSIDDFSWSKNTQPKLLRRRMADMATADCVNVSLFPDAIPINLANPADLLRLRALLPGRQVYIVAGSDVIEHASAYADAEIPGCANTFDHILFSRSRSEEVARGRSPDRKRRIKGQVIELSLPTYYEDVSSSRIRSCIDENLEISMLVDPLVEAFIYEHALYLRTPQDKVTAGAVPLSVQHTLENGVYSVCSSDAQISAHSLGAGALYAALGSGALADHVRRFSSGRLLMIDRIDWSDDRIDAASALLDELLTRSLSSDHTYALCIVEPENAALAGILRDHGFLPGTGDAASAWLVDMRAPVVLTSDAFLYIKPPLRDDPAVVSAVLSARTRLKQALCALFPGALLLSFDAARLNHLLAEKVRAYNGVSDCHVKGPLGPYMCVPYGKILSDAVVPNTVTKTLHAEKVFAPDIGGFTIEETPGYSPLVHQIRAIRSFMRPVLLVDDLLHNGYRLEKLDPLFQSAGVAVEKVIVGILSGKGQDLMDRQGRSVDAVYRIPNLRCWFNESLMYPYLGGDAVRRERADGGALPSINLILPYRAPTFIHSGDPAAEFALSMTALTNARDIMLALETSHQALARRTLTLARLGEALSVPRLPDRGQFVRYDKGVPASSYLTDDIHQMRRMYGGTDALLHNQ